MRKKELTNFDINIQSEGIPNIKNYDRIQFAKLLSSIKKNAKLRWMFYSTSEIAENCHNISYHKNQPLSYRLEH